LTWINEKAPEQVPGKRLWNIKHRRRIAALFKMLEQLYPFGDRPPKFYWGDST
jgi:hypothetical protein